MAQCDLFLTRADESPLVDYVLSTGGCFVSAVHYDKPSYPEIRSKDTYATFREMKPFFYILHPSFLRTDLEIRRLHEDDPSRGYFIMQRNGGPAIHLVCPGEYTEGAQAFIAPGFLSHYPTFWNPETGMNEKVPGTLRAYYKDLLKFIKKGAKKTNPRDFWVGRHAQKLVADGARLVGPSGIEYRVAD